MRWALVMSAVAVAAGMEWPDRARTLLMRR